MRDDMCYYVFLFQGKLGHHQTLTGHKTKHGTSQLFVVTALCFASGPLRSAAPGGLLRRLALRRPHRRGGSGDSARTGAERSSAELSGAERSCGIGPMVHGLEGRKDERSGTRNMFHV